MAQKDLDRIVDQMRASAIDLSLLSRAPVDAQIDAMVKVTLAHQYTNAGKCDCGWIAKKDPADFVAFQYEILYHILEDVATRVFRAGRT